MTSIVASLVALVMQINWCLKGISKTSTFDDAVAAAVLKSTGILSKWMLTYGNKTADQTNILGQNALNHSALLDHVNNYRKVAKDTPYISLCSGCIEFNGRGSPPIRYKALRTALNFATNGGKQSGYVFRCWVITGLKPAAELPGLAEEIRDLNLYTDCYEYHRQGEVTAKLVVPRRQVAQVTKVDQHLTPLPASWAGGGSTLSNSDFLSPDRVSNVIEEIN